MLVLYSRCLSALSATDRSSRAAVNPPDPPQKKSQVANMAVTALPPPLSFAVRSLNVFSMIVSFVDPSAPDQQE